MRNRLSPVIVRGTPLGLPTDKDLMENEEAALKSLPTSFDLPYDDGEPMESPWHLHQMVLLIDSLKAHWHDRDDFYCGGNMFVYFSDRQEFNRDFRGPDFFVVNGGVDRYKKRMSWVSWDEGGRLPHLIIELISQSTKSIDRGEKKKLYCGTFRVHEYICYDPAEERLEGWRRTEGSRYESITVEPNGRMWSDELGLFLGPWSGMLQDIKADWLRFYTDRGRMVLIGQEAAEAELARLRRENAALRKKRKNT